MKMELDARTYRGKVYKIMLYFFRKYRNKGVVLRIFNEGSSRSGKTFDTFDFLYDICAAGDGAYKIYVYRSTLQDCKEKALGDFKKKLQCRGIYDPDSMYSEKIHPEYHIGDSIIRFRGLDKMDVKEGHDCDIIYFNEMLDDISPAQFNNITMRCTTMIIGDWNPKYTEHWVFELEGQPDTIFTKTTYKDNPFCPDSVRRTIESYEPTPENIAAGTADEFRWKVYGLGERAAQEGLIFPNIDWIDSFPDDLEYTAYGIDFGFTNDPTAIIHVGVRGRDLYLHERFYSPVDDPEVLYNIVAPILGKHGYAIADSADKYAKNPEGMVRSLQLRGLNVIKAKKFQDSITIGISYMKNFRIHCVKTKNMKNEANTYVWDSINGLAINKPVDKNNHLWDAARYVVMTAFRNHIAA